MSVVCLPVDSLQTLRAVKPLEDSSTRIRHLFLMCGTFCTHTNRFVPPIGMVTDLQQLVYDEDWCLLPRAKLALLVGKGKSLGIPKTNSASDMRCFCPCYSNLEIAPSDACVYMFPAL